jgi:hypothetical protein
MSARQGVVASAMSASHAARRPIHSPKRHSASAHALNVFSGKPPNIAS